MRSLVMSRSVVRIVAVQAVPHPVGDRGSTATGRAARRAPAAPGGRRRSACWGASGADSPPIEREDHRADQPGQEPADAVDDRVADLLPLEPDVAGQRLVGPLARQRHLVPLAVDRRGQPQQAGARRVQDRPLRGADQLRDTPPRSRPGPSSPSSAASPAPRPTPSPATARPGPARSSPIVNDGTAPARRFATRPSTTVESSPPLR